MLEQFNAAVRDPRAHGGVECLPLLLDALAQGGAEPAGNRWIVDENARLDTMALLRHYLPDPEIHVLAAEYGTAAHTRGWLRLDRTLPAAELANLVDTVEDWAESDRSLDDALRAYGPPSVTFGDPDPRLPKTFGYASGDTARSLAVLHFGNTDDAPSAKLLAYRGGESFLGPRMSFTPLGDAVADEVDKRHR